MRPAFFGLLGLCLALGGCGASAYQASSGVRFDTDGAGREIDDEDVAKAFAAKPQLPATARVAFYTFDDEGAEDVEKMLSHVRGVTSVYRIPPLMVTGQRRFQETNPYANPPREVSIKKLRLLAARAHADLLVVFDHGYRGGGVNGWVALNALVLPIFFTPWLSAETESYAEAYLLDVRNGYLYGESSADAQGGPNAVTIFGPNTNDVAKEQWPKLLERVKTDLSTKLAQAPRPPVAVEAAASAGVMPREGAGE